MAGVVALVFLAFALGLLGNPPYVLFAAFWLMFAACLLNIRKAAPQFPELGVFAGWFVLVLTAVLIAYSVIHLGVAARS
jgi:apolipoprotein N-acyltransferase